MHPHTQRLVVWSAVASLLAGCAAATRAPGGSAPAASGTPRAAERRVENDNPGRAAAAVADSLRRLLDAAVRDSAFPGAYAAVGTRTAVLASYGAGHLDWPRPRA